MLGRAPAGLWNPERDGARDRGGDFTHRRKDAKSVCEAGPSPLGKVNPCNSWEGGGGCGGEAAGMKEERAHEKSVRNSNGEKWARVRKPEGREGGRLRANNRVKNRTTDSMGLAPSSSTPGPAPPVTRLRATAARPGPAPEEPVTDPGGGGASGAYVTALPCAAVAAVGVFADAQAPPLPPSFPHGPGAGRRGSVSRPDRGPVCM